MKCPLLQRRNGTACNAERCRKGARSQIMSGVLGTSQQPQPPPLWGRVSHGHTPTIPSKLRCRNCCRHRTTQFRHTFVVTHRKDPSPICLTNAGNQSTHVSNNPLGGCVTLSCGSTRPLGIRGSSEIMCVLVFAGEHMGVQTTMTSTKRLDPRVMNKCPTFSSRDTEWSEWSFIFESAAGISDGRRIHWIGRETARRAHF